MEELVTRISTAAHIDPALAQKAVGIILGFLNKEAPEHVSGVINAIPGAAEAVASAQATDGQSGNGGLMGSLMGMVGGAIGGSGGGLMGLASQLTGAGLGMGQMQTVGKELFAVVREKAGDEAVGRIAGAVPGLSQFI